MSEVTEGQWLEGNYPEARQEHQMTELQDALDYWDGFEDGYVWDDQFWSLAQAQALIEAARMWLNPNIEAAAKAAHEHVHPTEQWEDADPIDREMFLGEAKAAVLAALTRRPPMKHLLRCKQHRHFSSGLYRCRLRRNHDGGHDYGYITPPGDPK